MNWLHPGPSCGWMMPRPAARPPPCHRSVRRRLLVKHGNLHPRTHLVCFHVWCVHFLMSNTHKAILYTICMKWIYGFKCHINATCDKKCGLLSEVDVHSWFTCVSSSTWLENDQFSTLKIEFRYLLWQILKISVLGLLTCFSRWKIHSTM